jgi:hypothetical protein
MWPFTRKENVEPVWIEVPRPTGTHDEMRTIENLNGVSWSDAPLPPMIHRCTPQTQGWIEFDYVGRCACGAIQGNSGYWQQKNDRRKMARLYARL